MNRDRQSPASDRDHLVPGVHRTRAGDGSDRQQATLDRQMECRNGDEQSVDALRDGRVDGERVTTLFRDVVRTLVDGTSRESIDEKVCERLTAVDGVRGAWIGETDATSDQLAVRHAAGRTQSYLDERDIAVRDDRTVEPAGRAAATGSPRTVADVRRDDSAGGKPPAWRRDALDSGFTSILAVPLVYNDVLDGVVAVYSDEPRRFGERYRNVLTELGRAIGCVYDGIDRRNALVDDRATELDLRIPDGATAFGAFVDAIDESATVLGTVPQQDDSLRVFFTAGNAPRDQVADAADTSDGIGSASPVSERGEGLVYESVVDGDGFLGTLLDHVAVPETVEPAEDGVRVVVRLVSPTDVTSFVEMLQERYAGTEFRSRRSVERETGTRHDFRSQLERDLTDRQWDALQTAVLGGYFEWPRERSGEEVAAMLDVSQPTFNRHLRDGLRKLLPPLFDDDLAWDR